VFVTSTNILVFLKINIFLKIFILSIIAFALKAFFQAKNNFENSLRQGVHGGHGADEPVGEPE